MFIISASTFIVLLCICWHAHTHTQKRHARAHTHSVFDTAVRGLISGSRGASPSAVKSVCPYRSSQPSPACHVRQGSDSLTPCFVRWARRHARAEGGEREGRHTERESERLRNKRERSGVVGRLERKRERGEIKAKEVLTLAVMRNMEDSAEGDIMTLQSANQPLPCCCHRVTLRGVRGGTVLFKPTISRNQEHQALCANASSYTFKIE